MAVVESWNRFFLFKKKRSKNAHKRNGAKGKKKQREEERLRTILIVTLAGPRLPFAAMDEHLHAASHKILPAWAHGGVKGRLLLDFNQLTCNTESSGWGEHEATAAAMKR